MSEFLRIFAGYLFVLCFSMSVSAATYTVTKTADTNDGTCDADCSLREAVAAANATIDNDIIEFSALFNNPQTITLSGTDLIINNNGTLTINGTGADKITVSGNNASRVFTNNTGAVTAINRLRVTGGTGTSTVTTGRGGGVYNNGGTLTLNFLVITGNTATNGGGLNNAGTATLTISNTAIFGNTATGSGGGLQNFSGNTANIYNSSIYANTSSSTTIGGGGMQANGTVNIVNSTFSGNNAVGGSGGAIYFNGTSLSITNATILNNSASGAGGLHRTGTNPLNIRNSIIASNMGTAGNPDVLGAVNSQGNNIIGNVTGSSGWIGSDFQNVNPMLGALANNGGFSNTHLPLTGSPALDAGQNCVVDLSCSASNPPVAVTTDQRGVSRPQNAVVDIGAVEIAIAANAAISGQVLSPDGTPIKNAIVTISNLSGVLQTARTNSFGSFKFSNIPSGQNYTLNVNAKQYSFMTTNINVSGDVVFVSIVATSGNITDLK